MLIQLEDFYVNGNHSYTGKKKKKQCILYIIISTIFNIIKLYFRYIPIGLLEVYPQKINERAPPFFGRDDLETLMASPRASDWVKLT